MAVLINYEDQEEPLLLSECISYIEISALTVT